MNSMQSGETMSLADAHQGVRDVLAGITRPARVLVLAPRNCGLDELAEELGRTWPSMCVELRYYKPLCKNDFVCRTGIMRSRGQAAVTVRFQSPHADDPPTLFDAEYRFKFCDTLAPFTVLVKHT